MRKKNWILSILLSSSILFAEDQMIQMEKLMELPVGTASSKIQFRMGYFEGISPNALVSLDGRYLWIGEIDNAKIVDIFSKQIIRSVPYTDKGSIVVWGGVYHVFTKDSLYFGSEHLIKFNILKYPFSMKAPVVYENAPEPAKRLYRIHEYVFFYDQDGLVYAIDPKGAVLSNIDAVTLLVEWLKKTWYHNPEDRDWHEKLTGTGKYLIADGKYYPADMGQAEGYFKMKIPDWPFSAQIREVPLATDASPYGVSLNGDIYLGSKNGIDVIGQDGLIKASILKNKINPRIVDSFFSRGNNWELVSQMLFAVHPNGDLYSLYAIKDKIARIHYARKTWGNDLVGMARQGMKAGNNGETFKLLNAMSGVELGLLKNALFALHGYVFTDYDLSCYFGGYEWYKPNAKVKYDAAVLTAEQKRLFDLITNIEKAREQSLESTTSDNKNHVNPYTPKAIASSSFLTEKNDKNAYQPVKAFDGRLDTGWMENATGPGIDEWIEVVFVEPITVDKLTISPGWFDKCYWVKNNRIKSMRIELDSDPRDAVFEDKMTPQDVMLSAVKTISKVKFIIKEVYKTSKDDDTCISEIEFWNAGQKLKIDLSSFAEQLRIVPE